MMYQQSTVETTGEQSH